MPQLNALETVLAEDHDLVMCSVVVGEDVRSVCNDIIDSGTKLLLFARIIPDMNCLIYTGNQRGMGEQQAKWILNFFGDRPANGEDIQVLSFIGDDFNSVERGNGLTDTLAEGGIKVAQQLKTEFDAQKAQEIMENWLKSNEGRDVSNVKGIVTVDDAMSFGIMEAIRQYDGPMDVSNFEFIISIGASRDYQAALQHLRCGRQHHCVRR